MTKKAAPAKKTSSAKNDAKKVRSLCHSYCSAAADNPLQEAAKKAAAKPKARQTKTAAKAAGTTTKRASARKA